MEDSLQRVRHERSAFRPRKLSTPNPEPLRCATDPSPAGDELVQGFAQPAPLDAQRNRMRLALRLVEL